MTFQEMLVFATGLFSILNPFAVIGVFASTTQPYPKPTQRRMASLTALSVALVMVGTAAAGPLTLKLMGITVPMLQAAGGLIALVTGIGMVVGSPERPDQGQAATGADWRVTAVVPLAVPLTVGGGTLSYIVAEASGFPGFRNHAKISTVCVAATLVVWLAYTFAPVLARRLGPVGMAITARFSGIALASVGFGIFAAGMRGLFPGLSGIPPAP